jgi:hypothetical protein
MDNSEAEDLNARAQSIVDDANRHVKEHRVASAKAMEALGRKKADTLVNGIAQFVEVFKKFHNVELNVKALGERNARFDKQSFKELEKLSGYAGSLLSGVASGAAAGALTALGAYSAVAAFGTASTGTAIATLSGIAASNATLAWFAGGAIASGGGGIAAGTMVLGKIVAAPVIIIITGIMAAVKASDNLERARGNLAKAKEIAEELKTVAILCDGIRDRAHMFEWLLTSLDAILFSMTAKMWTIHSRRTGWRRGLSWLLHNGNNYTALSLEEKQIVAMAASVAQAISALLNTPLLTGDGTLTDESKQIGKSTRLFLEQTNFSLPEHASA